MEVLCEIQKDVNWELVQAEIALIDERCKKSLEDFILGKFDEEYLGDSPPESDWYVPEGDWIDWFPPPSRLTEEELDVLTDWVEIEAEKHDLFPDLELIHLKTIL